MFSHFSKRRISKEYAHSLICVPLAAELHNVWDAGWFVARQSTVRRVWGDPAHSFLPSLGGALTLLLLWMIRRTG